VAAARPVAGRFAQTLGDCVGVVQSRGVKLGVDPATDEPFCVMRHASG
jgi:hypothetical protein